MDSLVVIVLATNDVYMQSNSCALSEGLEHVRDHLCRQVSDLFSLELQVTTEVRSTRDV